ncbi:DNA cytosine methyltransferase [Actinoplanes regularis]|uniref:Cytosine-specific methyltransferase n=1 Tax=Actinoplanes regularis TaxID=52697 RepID=A0A239AVR7_9ACTN|nr:DNA cytosine methyltransferase [Actinoplanes regularis]GIE87364.1 cytosine-specific methyltransferase [Actinoplanes regularis]SNR99058.1 DNA (cytosine-5)-methyltransferase 1 [Actinoplanes regularis]
MAQTYRVVDLFAGCGGITSGLHKTKRYETVRAVEIDIAAATTYTENFGEGLVYPDSITGWEVDDRARKADVVVGGPPCQGFSNLGLKRPDDPRNQLWREYVRVLNAIEPKAFIIENVDRFLTSEEFKLLDKESKTGKLRDYELRPHLVNAAEFGSAQLRRRAIVIGTHRDLDPIEIPSEGRLPREKWVTVRDRLKYVDQRVAEDNQLLPKRSISHHGKVLPGAFSGLEIHVTRRYEDFSRERFREIPAGGNRFDLPDRLKSPCWLRHTTGSGDVMGRLRWDQPSVTIRTEFFKPEKGRYLHPSEHRAITHLEAALLQGFDNDFKWCGSKVQIARQIGNAVPVELAEAIGRVVAESLDAQG